LEGEEFSKKGETGTGANRPQPEGKRKKERSERNS